MSIFPHPQNAFAQPCSCTDPVENSTARILHNLVLALAIWLAFLDPPGVLSCVAGGKPQSVSRSLLLALLIVALILLRLGFLQTAGWHPDGNVAVRHIIMVLTGGASATAAPVFICQPADLGSLALVPPDDMDDGLMPKRRWSLHLMDLAGVKLIRICRQDRSRHETFLVLTGRLDCSTAGVQVLRTPARCARPLASGPGMNSRRA